MISPSETRPAPPVSKPPRAAPAEIHDAPHTRGARRGTEMLGPDAVVGLEGVGSHRMNEVVGDVDAGERRIERGPIEHVAAYDRGRRRDARPQMLGMAGEA